MRFPFHSDCLAGINNNFHCQSLILPWQYVIVAVSLCRWFGWSPGCLLWYWTWTLAWPSAWFFLWWPSSAAHKGTVFHSLCTNMVQSGSCSCQILYCKNCHVCLSVETWTEKIKLICSKNYVKVSEKDIECFVPVFELWAKKEQRIASYLSIYADHILQCV